MPSLPQQEGAFDGFPSRLMISANRRKRNQVELARSSFLNQAVSSCASQRGGWRHVRLPSSSTHPGFQCSRELPPRLGSHIRCYRHSVQLRAQLRARWQEISNLRLPLHGRQMRFPVSPAHSPRLRRKDEPCLHCEPSQHESMRPLHSWHEGSENRPTTEYHQSVLRDCL
jgi:hypothetical protein